MPHIILVTLTLFSRSQRVFDYKNAITTVAQEGNIGFCSYMEPRCTCDIPTCQSILVTLTLFSRSRREHCPCYEIWLMSLLLLFCH